MKISSYDVAKWLQESDDEAFAEAFVLWMKMRNNNEEEGLYDKDMLEADIEGIANTLKDILKEIIPIDSDIDESAWWKRKKHQYAVTCIEWDIDMDEVYEKLDEITIGEAIEVLGCDAAKYANSSLEEKHEMARDIFHNQPGRLYDFLLLPEEEPIVNMEYSKIINYLSDSYGYRIKNCNISRIC